MSRGVRVNASGVDGIDVVRYGTWFPYRIKFHASRLFDTAMRRQADLICKALGGPPDLIWDFDNTGQFADLRSFRAKQSLFHLVDAPSRSSVGTKHADKLATLAPAFMIKSGHPANVPVVGHGLAQVHANLARQRLRDGLSALGTDVAMVGNLGAVWIDWPVIAAMVSRLPDRKIPVDRSAAEGRRRHLHWPACIVHRIAYSPDHFHRIRSRHLATVWQCG